jgi:hypothetical protein
MYLPEPGWPTDPRMICVCIALQEMYERADTDPNQALCAWGYHHHIHAMEMKMEDLKHEPLTMLTCVAGTLALQKNVYDKRGCNEVLCLLSLLLNYKPEYYDIVDDLTLAS